MERHNIEVFKTNIIRLEDAAQILELLNSKYPKHNINFDIEDCDKILRIEGIEIEKQKIINLLFGEGFQCVVLL